MRTKLLRIAATVGALALLTGSAPANSVPKLTEEQKALHVLNRLGYGPRPGDVEMVLEMGIDRYVEAQLRPDRIDDAAVEKKLERLDVVNMSEDEVYETFAKPFMEMQQERRRQQQSQTKKSKEVTEEDASRQAREMRDVIPPESRPRRILQEISAAKVIRAVESERQLEEVMADFWLNHFNVAADKGNDRFFIATYERDVIKPNMWGSFEDLLRATAKSPAMLFYLDNARSVATEENRPTETQSGFAGRFDSRGSRVLGDTRRVNANRQVQQRIRNAGLNENYARELLELHTLGVDGGYDQRDVTELARVLTGWSISGQRGNGDIGFVFQSQLHDVRPKEVLGYTFGSGGGIEEGEKMIQILAHHPSTAKHIATKLCQRFVSDDPPQALVDRVAKRFLQTGGDLRETVRAVLASPEFFDPTYYRAKTKTPLEYVASAIRAVGGTTDGRAVSKMIADMGQPLYLCQPPNGYSETAEDWISSGALLARINFSIALAANRVSGTKVNLAPDSADPELVDKLSDSLVGGDLSKETRATIISRLESEDVVPKDRNATLVAGLILGSPEFQRQ